MSQILEELRAMRLVKAISFTNRETGERESRDVVLYEGLLHAAKQVGLVSIQTVLVQPPSDVNAWTAICHARVELKAGVFTGIGDATPANVNSRIKPAFIRMAETRAKARALRDAVDLRGVVCFEELDESEPTAPEHRGNGLQQPGRVHSGGNGVNRIAGNGNGNGRLPDQRNQAPGGNGHGHAPAQPQPRQPSSEGPGRPMSERQRRFLFRLLAERGVEGRAATDELCRLLGVPDLRGVTAQAASALIDQLNADAVNAAEH